MPFFDSLPFNIIPLGLLAIGLLCISVIDIKTHEIPDGFLLFLLLVGILWVISGYTPFFKDIKTDAPTWQNALLGAAAGAGPLFAIDRICIIAIKKEGFGYGDIKLMGVSGLFLGWQPALIAIIIAFVTGGLFGFFLLAARKANKGAYFAFAPFLSLGVICALCFGERIMLFLP